MPHQLRRIISINIRNPMGGLPSGRIAELDPRGGVLAVGGNGVGKTTFLRLLPLFYGATPSQILRGSGHTSMITHTLPDPSSAVAYEYEREDGTDLRLAVMHAKPSEEAPQFHLLKCGYDERLFYDENDEFVTRDEFKLRAMSLGYEVSPKLSLHQYRSVILNERLVTKEAAEMRRLAAVYSLGPRPLHNLEQVAAAMANEKIQFRDLQNIVIDRVSDSQEEGGRQTNVRELKQNRDAVNRWIEDRDHLGRVMARRGDAEALRAKVAKTKTAHHELCALHVAVKRAIAQLASDLEQLETDEAALQAEYESKRGELRAEQDRVSEERRQATEAYEGQRDIYASAVSRLERFKRNKVEDLAGEQVNEEAYGSRRANLESERRELNNRSGDVQQRAQSRREAVRESLRIESERISNARTDLSRTTSAQLEQSREDEQHALDTLASPARLDEIAKEKLRLAGMRGQLSADILNPMASAETQRTKDALELDVQKADKAITEASGHKDEAQAALQVARRASEEATGRVDALLREEYQLQQRIEQLQDRLKPPAGSLQELLNAQEPSLWEPAARVIAPDLLKRTDLAPTIHDEARALSQALPLGTVQVGPLVLDVTRLATPDWVDMKDVREQLQRAEDARSILATSLKNAKKEADQLARAASAAQTQCDSRQAEEGLARAAAATTRERLIAAASAVAAEKRDRRAAAEAEARAVDESIHGLEREEAELRAGLAASRTSLRVGFEAQRRNLLSQRDAAEARLLAEQQQAKARYDEQLQAIEADVAAELKGLGIDPERMVRLDREIAELGARLESIARNRHEVAAWHQFQQETLPTMDATKQHRDLLQQQADKLGSRLRDLQTQLNNLDKNANTRAEAIATARTAKRGQSQRLTELLSGGLANFIGYAGPVEVAWDVADLEFRVRETRAGLESLADELRRETRALRSDMQSRDGPVSHWLELKLASLPDPQTVLEHEFLCATAEALCDWFTISESGPYIDQTHREMNGFLNLAGEFLRSLDQFDRNVSRFNRELQAALKNIASFERFQDLSVTVRSAVNQLGYINVLREMQDLANSKGSTLRSFSTQERVLPTDEETNLIRAFRDLLQGDGGFRINLNEQVQLECSLIENGIRRTITNEDEFRGVSSTGNTALIIAMFLIGFIEMIRGPNSPVHITWISDEIGRYDSANLRAFLDTLARHHLDVICASPDVNPAVARYFPKISIFESNGSVTTSQPMGVAYGTA